MNPIKNKKNLDATIDEIRNFAYAYVEKYSPSKQQLRTYLFKKLINKSDKTIFAILNGKIIDNKGRNVISYGDIIRTGTLRKLSQVFKIKGKLTILRVSG